MSDTITPPPVVTATSPVADTNDSKDSCVFGVSIRAWLAWEIVTAVIILSFMNVVVQEPLYTLASLAIGFYFGQKTK